MSKKLDVEEHIVNFNSCIGCGICELVCPEECITMVQDDFLSFKPQVDYDKCSPCLGCVKVCPDSFHLINKVEKQLERHSKNDNYIVYIGSTKSIKDRLLSYIYGNAHTKELREFIKEKVIYFRYIEVKDYKSYEKELMYDFINFSGALPLLNRQRVK